MPEVARERSAGWPFGTTPQWLRAGGRAVSGRSAKREGGGRGGRAPEDVSVLALKDLCGERALSAQPAAAAAQQRREVGVLRTLPQLPPKMPEQAGS